MELEADVCIVGAGYAGLTAARRLSLAGKSVIVLEARARVGGRVWTERLPDGTVLDIGGAWLGPGQDAAYGLAKELGVATYPSYGQGDTVLVGADGGLRRYRGTVPKMNPLAIASLAQGMLRLDAMARSVPLEAPWTAKHARAWDSRSAGSWVDAQVPTKIAKALLLATVRGLMSCDSSEVSLLHLLYLIRSAGNLNSLLSIDGGYQQDRFSGGAQLMADRMAAELGDAVRLSEPVRAIEQDGNGVMVHGEHDSVRARRAVVALPPSLAADVRYSPALPQDRAQLMERMPAGSVMKALVVYPDAFWRSDGLSGQTVALNSPIELTLDASPASGSPGIMACFAFGPLSRRFVGLEPEQRRDVVLGVLKQRLGPKAADPASYVEHDWAQEEWTRGCSMSRLAPGVLTQFGHALRTPCGRIHWAGTETATKSHGTIDGAIRSGERAAAEIVAVDGSGGM